MAYTASNRREPPLPRLNAESKMDVLRKVARVLGEHFDIQVVFRGNQAYTDGRTIVVPALPENAPDDLVDAIIGFVDHEAGHIRYTDFTAVDRLIKPDPDKRAMHMTNCVEDIRQEFLMAEDFRGVGLTLERTLGWVLERLVKQWNQPQVSDFFKITTLMMLRAKEKLGVPTARDFLTAMVTPAQAEILDKVDAEVAGWFRLPNTDEAYHAAKRALKMLDDMNAAAGEPPPAPDQGGQKQQQGKSQQKAKPEKGESEEKQKGAGQPGQGKPEEKEDEDEAKGGGQSQDGSEPKPGEQDGQGEGGEGEQQGEQQGEQGQGEQGQGEQGQGGGEEGEQQDGEASGGASQGEAEGTAEHKPLSSEAEKILQNLTAKYDPKKANNLHDFGAAQIVLSATECSGHRPYTTEFDQVVPPAGTATLAQYSKRSGEVKKITDVVSGVLVRTLLTQTRARTLRQRSSGAISLSNMAQIKAHQPNIFQIKRKAQDLDTYVELIVDHSGSMSGAKIQTAAKTCLVLADALDKVGVTFGICGFTAGFGYEEGLTAAQIAAQDAAHTDIVRNGKGHDFERLDPIIEYTYKTGEESYAKVKTRLALMENQFMGCNADGDSILKIAKRVARRREARKILIVMSDGLPAAGQGRGVPSGAADRYLKKVVPLIEQAGIEVLGIGINSDAPGRYYKKWIKVTNVNELPKLAMNELKGMLLGKTKAAA